MSEFGKHKKNKDGLNYWCKKCFVKVSRQWAKKNPKKVIKASTKWSNANLDRVRINNKNNKKHNRKDPIIRLKHNISSLIGKSIKNKGFSKNSQSVKILGCSVSELKNHLIQTFEMNYCILWHDDYLNMLQIDHIYPCKLAKNEDEVYSLNHYSNLQYLFTQDNQTKQYKIDFTLYGDNDES